MYKKYCYNFVWSNIFAIFINYSKPVGIAVERAGGQMASVETFIHGTEEFREADRF